MAWMLLKSWQVMKGPPNCGTPQFTSLFSRGVFKDRFGCSVGLTIVWFGVFFACLPYFLKVYPRKKRNCFLKMWEGLEVKRVFGTQEITLCEDPFPFLTMPKFCPILRHPQGILQHSFFPPLSVNSSESWIISEEEDWFGKHLNFVNWITRFDQISENVSNIIVALPSEWKQGTVVVVFQKVRSLKR